MAIRERYIERLIDLFKAYMNGKDSLETFEEVRYRAHQLGKRLFKEKVPLDWIVGLYIEAVRNLRSETREEALDLSGCENLLLEMVMTYSTSLLESIELEQRLQESERRFRRIAERSFDAIVTLDPSGLITYASPATERISGRDLEDILGRPFYDLVCESDIPKATEALAEVMERGYVNRLQIEMLRGDGSLVTVEVNASPLTSDGEAVGVEGVFRDITESKKAKGSLREYEEKYRNLVNNSNDIVCTADEGGNWISLSPSVKRILGYEPQEMVGRSAFDFLFPEDAEPTREAHKSVVEEGKSFREYKNRWMSRNGRIVTLAWNVVPLKDEKGRIIGIQGVGREITERKKSGQPKRQAS
jgi:PAS domain S-box-containing protein